MSYCGEPFRHDIFVSYSHGSDDRGKGHLQPWSLAFVRAVVAELEMDPRYRDTLSVFFDAEGEPGARLDPALPLTEQLEAQAQSAALLMVLLSPDYQRSAWCADERAWWLRKQSELKVSGSGRLEVVHMMPVDAHGWPAGVWPPELSDGRGAPLVGHCFHDNARVGARPLGISQVRAGQPFSNDVFEKVLTFARTLYDRLDAARDEATRLRAAIADSRRLASAGGQTLYLHARTGQAKAWDATASELQDGGFYVFPDRPDPLETDPSLRQRQRERRVEELANCDALLLLGTSDEPTLDADLLQVGRTDRQSARQRAERHLPCALLNAAGEPLATERRRANARVVQADWLDVAGRPVVPVVQQWLHGSAARASP